MHSNSETWCKNTRNILTEDPKLSKLSSDAGLKLVETGQYFYTFITEEGQQMQHQCLPIFFQEQE